MIGSICLRGGNDAHGRTGEGKMVPVCNRSADSRTLPCVSLRSVAVGTVWPSAVRNRLLSQWHADRFPRNWLLRPSRTGDTMTDIPQVLLDEIERDTRNAIAVG